jgi:hypothetical protein
MPLADHRRQLQLGDGGQSTNAYSSGLPFNAPEFGNSLQIDQGSGGKISALSPHQEVRPPGQWIGRVSFPGQYLYRFRNRARLEIRERL